MNLDPASQNHRKKPKIGKNQTVAEKNTATLTVA